MRAELVQTGIDEQGRELHPIFCKSRSTRVRIYMSVCSLGRVHIMATCQSRGHTSLQERVGDTGQSRAQGSHLPASTRDAHAMRGEQSCSTGTLFKRKQVAF